MADVSELTHNRVRPYDQRHVHLRLTIAPKLFYVTACGQRVPKENAVLTAAAVDCEHHGCKAVDRG